MYAQIYKSPPPSSLVIKRLFEQVDCIHFLRMCAHLVAHSFQCTLAGTGGVCYGRTSCGVSTLFYLGASLVVESHTRGGKGLSLELSHVSIWS